MLFVHCFEKLRAAATRFCTSGAKPDDDAVIVVLALEPSLSSVVSVAYRVELVVVVAVVVAVVAVVVVAVVDEDAGGNIGTSTMGGNCAARLTVERKNETETEKSQHGQLNRADFLSQTCLIVIVSRSL